MLGIFREPAGGGGRLVPIDKKQLGRELGIAAGATAGAADGDLVAVEVARQGRFGLTAAKVVERLGSLKSERAVSLIAIHAHAIPYEFPRAVIDEAEAARSAAHREAWREDWRDVPFVTIDPPDAKDHDDAVHALPDPDPNNAGGFLVDVAIADVAHYVRPGSALDREAVRRGNSVYFPDRVVPMLPERISNDLCSLRPSEDRAALAVRMVIGADGRKRSHTFHRVLIRSAAKLSYEQAQRAVDGQPDETTAPIAAKILEPLYAAYRTVLKARDQRGPLDLNIPERKIVLKPDGTVDRVITPQRLDAHRLIEEFMILANVAAAETCERAKVAADLSRTRRAVAGKAQCAARIFGDDRYLAAEGPDAAARTVSTTSWNGSKAATSNGWSTKWCCAARLRPNIRPENFGHFGLNLRRYAHFTSPIRRYADLVVHRALIRARQVRRRRFARRHRHPRAGRNRRDHFRHRTPRHEGRTRNRRPADRAFSRRPHRRDFRRAYFRRHPRRPVRRTRRDRRRRIYPGALHRRRIFPVRRSRPRLCRPSVTHRLGDPVTVELVEAAPVAGALRFKLAGQAGRAMAACARRAGKDWTAAAFADEIQRTAEIPQARPKAKIDSDG